MPEIHTESTGSDLAEATKTLLGRKGEAPLSKQQIALYIALIAATIIAVSVSMHFPAFAQELFLLFAFIVGLSGSSLITSISLSKRSNAALKDQTDFYKALLHAQSDLGEGLIVMEKDRILYANSASSDITGFTADELTAMPSFLLLVAPEDKDILADRLRRRLKGEDVEEQYETTIIHKNGNRIELEISLKKFYIKDKMRLAVIARDISERKKVENAKSEFVSWVSHQLRTPLTASSYLAEILLSGDEGKLTIEQVLSIQRIYDANQRMIGLINSLLNVAQIELGTMEIERSPTSLTEVCDSALGDLDYQITIKHIQIKRIYDNDIPMIDLDPRLIRMVFQNLISNAVKYTSTGKISITIKHESKNAIVSIKDTGFGIPKKAQKKVFSKLFRAENVISKEIEGTGLGLYIIKAVVEMFYGKIWFDSEEGKGTTFFVSLPFSQEEPAKENVTSDSKS
jgi:PAS domain S-box-containing protein